MAVSTQGCLFASFYLLLSFSSFPLVYLSKDKVPTLALRFTEHTSGNLGVDIVEGNDKNGILFQSQTMWNMFY